jgi:hypothetical protein
MKFTTVISPISSTSSRRRFGGVDIAFSLATEAAELSQAPTSVGGYNMLSDNEFLSRLFGDF